MKIVAIIGSPRKKINYDIIKLIDKKLNLKLKVNIKYIFLNEINLKFCKGCGYCLKKNNCIIKDDAIHLKNDIFNSDGIIFSTPVYEYRESALIKNFMDRFHYLFFYPTLFDKFAIVLTVAAKSGLLNVTKYLNFTAISWGYNLIGELKIISYLLKTDVDYQNNLNNKIDEILEKINKIKNNKYKKLINFDELVIFKDKKNLVKAYENNYNEVYNYWKIKKWLDKDYYTDIKLTQEDKIKLKNSEFYLSKN